MSFHVLSKFVISKFDISKFDISKFDISKIDISKVDISKFDISKCDISKVSNYEKVKHQDDRSWYILPFWEKNNYTRAPLHNLSLSAPLLHAHSFSHLTHHGCRSKRIKEIVLSGPDARDRVVMEQSNDAWRTDVELS